METNNKQIVLACYRDIIRDLNFSLVDTYIADHYIQHSPTVKDGKQGLLEMLRFLEKLPRPTTRLPSPIIRAIGKGDFVAVHLDVMFMGKRAAVVDLFRLNNGKIAEHWDVAMEQPIDQPGAVTITNGRTMIDETASSQQSEEVVKRYYESAGNDVKPADVSKFISNNYIGHSPAHGLFEHNFKETKIHHLVSEGDFVVAHFEAMRSGVTIAQFHIFRIASNKIAEHWCVEQQVPETMAHDNGMF